MRWFENVLWIAGFVVFFSICHVVSPRLSPKTHRDAYDAISCPMLKTYWRRMVRSEIYYMYAGFSGIVIILSTYSSVEELLTKYNPLIAVHMCLATAHWLLTAVEDVNCWTYLAVDIRDVMFVRSLAVVYFIHHTVTIFAYAYVLVSEDLSSLGIFGLIFEVPVAMQTWREFVVSFASYYETPSKDKNEIEAVGSDPTMTIENERSGVENPRRRLSTAVEGSTLPSRSDWFRGDTRRAYWFVLFAAILLCRVTPCLLFAYSVVMWRDTINILPLSSRIVYYILGTIFSVANPAYGALMALYCRKDLQRPSDFDGGEGIDDGGSVESECVREGPEVAR